MSKREHQPTAVGDLFRQRQFNKLEQHVNAQQQLQELGAPLLAEFNLTRCRIASIKHGQVLIEAPSPSWLTRLKQFRFELLSKLRQQMPSVVSLDFKVNPNLSSIKPKVQPKSTVKRALSPVAAKHITDLAEQVPKELREKLERLAALGGEKS